MKLTVGKNDIRRLPSETGIYFFLKKGKPLYIGKAINLKARVASHIRNSQLNPKEKLIVEQADQIQILTMDSEFNALLLEARLIKQHQPKYNIDRKDSKSPLYIKITRSDRYPKIFPVRQENDGESLYFGPFNSSRIVNQLLREIRKIIPFCAQKKTGWSACFYSKIGLCDPCPAAMENLTDKQLQQKLRRRYQGNLRKIILILRGKSGVVLVSLTKMMESASQKEDYETALILRDKITFLHHLLRERSFSDVDVFTLTKGRQHALRKEMADFFQRYFQQTLPKRRLKIEGYDVSHLFGDSAVAALVVFHDDFPSKKDYRRFKIKMTKTVVDTDMISEVLRRRLRHKDWPDPDLLVVDGGKPQVRAFNRVLKENQRLIPLIGFAKRPDRIIIGTTLQTIHLPHHSPLLMMLQNLRDETHRFAQRYHFTLRRRNMI